MKVIYYGSSHNKNGVNFTEYFSINGFIIGRYNTYCGKVSLFKFSSYVKKIELKINIFNKRRKFKHSYCDHEKNIIKFCILIKNSIFFIYFNIYTIKY